jgi:hypothetical protein
MKTSSLIQSPLSPASQFTRIKVVLFVNPHFIFVEVFTNFGLICVGTKNSKDRVKDDAPLAASTDPNGRVLDSWGTGDGDWNTGSQANGSPESGEQADGGFGGDPGF